MQPKSADAARSVALRADIATTSTSLRSRSRASNHDIAEAFRRVSELLEVQHADPYRVRAYARAASAVDEMAESLGDIFARGEIKALIDLPTIGSSLAAAIVELLDTGHLRLLGRLEGQVAPEALFMTLPGMGETLAHKVHEALHVETLEELEVAAHDGRLAKVPGFGPRRVRALQAELGYVLSSAARRRARLFDAEAKNESHHPPVRLILELDRKYRKLATADQLPRISPRRFNPKGRFWLPVLHTRAEEWEASVMFSNTATAHRLGRTDDWVVVYLSEDGHEHRYTVVTEYRGHMIGKRVVRGQEQACADWYGSREN